MVKNPRGPYKKGDVILVYTYLGEGFFRVKFNGHLYEEDLGFSPYGGSPGNRCELDPQCLGELELPLQYTWWVRIQREDGTTGWTEDSEHFEGKDRCG